MMLPIVDRCARCNGPNRAWHDCDYSLVPAKQCQCGRVCAGFYEKVDDYCFRCEARRADPNIGDRT